MLFWSLLNIPSHLRSKLSTIHLLAVAKTDDCKRYGVKKLMGNFTAGLRELFQGIDVPGVQSPIRGGLVAFLGDTLASNLIGGFKEGVGFANKFCRTCEITSEGSSTIYYHEDCITRTDAEHRENCKKLDLPLTKAARQYWSTQFGINDSSFLLDVPCFDIIECMINDPMHLLFEGVTMLETKLLLKYIIYQQNFCTLAYFNRCLLDSFANLPPDGRPNIITKGHLDSDDNKLKQTAHQMWILAHIMPQLIGHKIPTNDEKWINFLRLIQIQQLCTSPISSEHTSTSLSVLISNHNKAFLRLYPDCSFIPKLHFLIHLPHQLTQFGPLRHHWCMRMESKNSFFKRTKYRNTKNLPFTVAQEHQQWLCYQQHDNEGNLSKTYLMKPCVTQPGAFVSIDEIEDKELLIPFIDQTQHLLEINEATLHGVTYKVGDYVIKKIGSLSDFPLFLSITNIFKADQNIYCTGRLSRTEYFDNHLNSYVTFLTHKRDVFLPAKMPYPWPVIRASKDEGGVLLSPISLPDIEQLI